MTEKDIFDQNITDYMLNDHDNDDGDDQSPCSKW